RQQDVFSINLVMSIALQDFIGSRGCILRTLGETIKSHHNILSLWSSLGPTQFSIRLLQLNHKFHKQFLCFPRQRFDWSNLDELIGGQAVVNVPFITLVK